MSLATAGDVAPYFHVTVLSNFARAYDKYRRVYSKRRVPESTYPACFYVLGKSDLAVGRAKASVLLEKLALSGDDLLVLESRLPRAALEAHPRGGPGLVWPSPDLPIDRVHRISGDDITPTTAEDSMARSFAVGGHPFAPYASLRPRSISFLPIARGCQARCPFCFSEASVSSEQRQSSLDAATVDAWLRSAGARGAERAVITGGGEPTLLGEERTLALIRACASRSPKVVLITNGVSLARAADAAAAAGTLRAAGLSVLAVSRHHPDEEVNARLMGLSTGTPRLLAAVSDRDRGLRLRLVCVLQRGGVETEADVEAYVAWAAAEGADEVCFKELYVSTSHESVYHSRVSNEWAAAHQVPLRVVVDWAHARGARTAMTLPWGAPVYDVFVHGRPIRIAAYTEPSLFWERTRGIARSWNIMADGRCLASLEDRGSVVALDEAEVAS
ncbi:MAG: radical SAM protein [Polyangiaceae bacterium]